MREIYSSNPTGKNIPNIFYVKNGKFWIKREEPLSFLEFKGSFLSTPHFCNNEEDLDLSTLQRNYEKYLVVFHSGDFPAYKRSRINLALSLCRMNSKIEFYIDRGYKKEIARDILSKRQNTNSLSSFIERFGPEIGELKFQRYRDSWKSSISKHDKKELYKKWKNLPEYYLDKINPDTQNYFTITEAEEKIKNDLSKGFKKVWKEYREGRRDKSFINTTKEYYEKNGMSHENAMIALKERQATFSLEKCIQKYGRDKGIERFNKRNKKWIDNLNSKSPEEKERISISKMKNFHRYSKESMDFFNSLLREIKKNILYGYDILMGEDEMVLWDPNLSRPYFYDFAIPELKLIIEYNGSTFHPDVPNMTEEQIASWVCPLTKQNAIEKYNKDQTKNNFARSLDYDLLVIWDKEEYTGKVKKCKELIEKKLKNKKNE